MKTPKNDFWIMVLAITVLSFSISFAGKTIDAQDLFNMSFEELLNIEIDTGTLTGIERAKIPGAFFSITAQDVVHTPARNILDLIEVYVPGATFVNHWLGPRLGIRGVLGDQNNSYLLLVNGKNMNMKCSNGPIFEIQNKDMNDIERIDIISGPGSVTYGPGAIGGIINIITKTADSTDGLEVKMQGNQLYRYGVASASYGYRTDKLKMYFYASTSHSKGEKNTDYFYVDRAYGYGYGYMGPDWGNKGLGTPAPHLYDDFWDKPEYKLHLDVQFLQNWKFWGRFTTFNYTSLQQESVTADGLHFPGLFGKMFTVNLENKHPLSDHFTLSSAIGFNSQSHRHVLFYQGPSQVADHITQRHYSFSENEINLDFKLNYQFKDKTRIALGSAFYYQYLGPEWGMDDKSFILPFPSPILFAVLDSLSGFNQTYGPNGITSVIDKKIDGYQASFFGELNYKLNSQTSILLSSRVDKHEYAQWAHSPRLAIIRELNKRNIIKLIGQRSVRLTTFPELYTEHQTTNKSAKPEKLDGVELIFHRMQNQNIQMELSGFYDTIDQLAWYQKDESGHNWLLGTLKKIGLEAKVTIKDQHKYAGLSYSFIHQLDWDPVEKIEAWIVGPNEEEVVLRNFGVTRINNVPKHALKMFCNYTLNNYTLHVNSRLCWDYQQARMLDSFMEANNTLGIPEYIAEMNHIDKALKDHGYTRPSFTLNSSFTWKAPVESIDFFVQAYAMNLLSVNHIRYVFQYWDQGNNRQFPRQCSFLEEPLSVGVKLSANF